MKKYIIIAIVVLLVLLGSALGWLYRSPLTPLHERVLTSLHLPIAQAGGSWITMNSLSERYVVAQKVFKQNKATPPADLRAQLLNKAVDEAVMFNIARQHGISVSDSDVNNEYVGYVAQATGGDLNKFSQLLESTYGLTPDSFRHNIILPQITQTKLTVWFNGNKDLNKDAFARLDQIKQALANNQSFEDTTKAYSQDEASKPFSGDLGYVKTADLLPELKIALANAATGTILYPPSRYGLHVIKVLDVKEDNGQSMHLQAMLVPENGYGEWYNNQTKTVKVRHFIKI